MTLTNSRSLKSIIGKGYADFWRFHGRYRALKGGRGSKKSTTTALWFIYHMMKYPDANTLVVRKIYKDHKDSTYTQLKWAINRLGVSHLWHTKLSPLEIIYKPTGQKILFRGLDDPMSITSITVDHGFLSWAWFEEAYQVANEDDFNKVDMSIRGDTGALFKQLTITFNPWNEKHWLKSRFFDHPNPNVLALTTNYMCNEFLGDDDRELFEWMKRNSPRRYKIEGLGEWGIAEGAIFENWHEEEFDYQEIAARESTVSCYGLDFGYTVDPSAFVASLIDLDARELYIYDEHYERAMTNDKIAAMLKYKGVSKERIIADCAEPKSIDEIRKYGISRMRPADKGRDSVLNGIQFLQQFKIYVHPKCVNTIIEFSNYVWSTNKDGALVNKPIDEYNHIIDALRYSVEPVARHKQSRLITPSQSLVQQIEGVEDPALAQTGGKLLVKSEAGAYLPKPVERKKKRKGGTCPECGARYTMLRGGSGYCSEHGWQGNAGVPNEYVVR